MSSKSFFFKPMGEMRELSLLQELQRNPVISQRQLSRQSGMALGVTNACLRAMAEKGWIQRKGLDHNRHGYFLTPKGLTEERNLSSHLASWRVQHYQALKEMIEQRYKELEMQGSRRIAFYGVSHEMEVAYLALQGFHMELVGIFGDDSDRDHGKLFGHTLKDLSQLMPLSPDVVLITSLAGQEERLKKIRQWIDPERIRIWSLSHTY